MQFLVDYSREKDVQNYLNAGWKFTYAKHGRENIQERLLQNYPQDFKTKLLEAKTKDVAEKVVKDFIDSHPENFNRITKLVIKICQQVLDEEKQNIIDLLQKIYQKPFPFEKITVYITTFSICPYNYKDRWFMVSRNNSIAGFINTAKHELNHFMFYYYYSDKLMQQKISQEKREKLKEALAIFSNPEGNDKPDVKELETYLRTLNGKTMDEVIDLSLESKYL